MQIFVSYSRVDKDFAIQLVDRLSDYDVSIWLDLRNIPHGANWDMEVQKGLETSDSMLVLLSPDSSASENVADEWSYFITKDKPIIPLLVRPCDVPFRLMRRQRVDFTGEFKPAFAQLIRALGNPVLRDPDETSKMTPLRLGPSPFVSTPGLSEPSSSYASHTSAPPASRAPAQASLKRQTQLEVTLHRFPVVWGSSYHWFNGLQGAMDGELLINAREVMLVPRFDPLQAIPLRSVVSAQLERGANAYLKLNYNGVDGRARTVLIMGQPPRTRQTVATEIIAKLKEQTGRPLE
ncbi:MAG: toll/interleukin-1 receptor domain-containing protein [Anaerolineae bacterium]|nr:toll/interleukin-1 receptor domain-containing protein [Anaerolineae bacterium]